MLLRLGPYTLRPTTNLSSICNPAWRRQLWYFDSAKPTTLQMKRTHKPTNHLDIQYTQEILIYIYLQRSHTLLHILHYQIIIITQSSRIFKTNVSTYTTYIFIKLHDSTLLQCGLICYGLLSESNDNKQRLSAPNDYLFWLLPGADWPRPTDPFTLYRHRLSTVFIYVWINTLLAGSKLCLQSLLVCTSNGRLLNSEAIWHYYTLPYLELTVHPRVDRAQNNIGAPYSQKFQSTLDS